MPLTAALVAGAPLAPLSPTSTALSDLPQSWLSAAMTWSEESGTAANLLTLSLLVRKPMTFCKKTPAMVRVLQAVPILLGMGYRLPNSGIIIVLTCVGLLLSEDLTHT